MDLNRVGNLLHIYDLAKDHPKLQPIQQYVLAELDKVAETLTKKEDKPEPKAEPIAVPDRSHADRRV